MRRLLPLMALCLVACSRPPPELLRVDPARFSMGSAEDEVGRDADEALHDVTLSRSFRIGRTEVTRREWKRVMGRPAPGRDSWGDEHPATVSWLDALRYCDRRSQLEGLQPAYRWPSPTEPTWNRDADGYRLPTEAEWALAARGEGGALAARAWCGDVDAPSPQPVGLKAANPRGLHDTIGNVEEWVFDRYAALPSSPQLDPVGPPTGALRVARGGSYSDDERHCRTADRSAFEPDRQLDSLGFRVAR